jgi:hypothetical protein
MLTVPPKPTNRICSECGQQLNWAVEVADGSLESTRLMLWCSNEGCRLCGLMLDEQDASPGAKP